MDASEGTTTLVNPARHSLLATHSLQRGNRIANLADDFAEVDKIELGATPGLFWRVFYCQ